MSGTSAEPADLDGHRLLDGVFGLHPLDDDLRARILGLVSQARAAVSRASVHRAHTRVAALTNQDQLPETGLPPEVYVDGFLRWVLDEAVPTSSPRNLANMASVIPTSMPYLAALVTAMNQNLVKSESSRALSLCETQLLRMLHHLVFPSSRSPRQHPLGVVTTGGSLANITALWSARNRLLDGRDGAGGVRQVGLAAALERRGARGLAIVGSSSLHYSFAKAADLLGVGSDGLVEVPVDALGRILVPAAAEALDRCRRERQLVLSLVGVAGSTDCGAVDALEELADLAAHFQVPFHVDAAWGGPVLMSERHHHLLRGIERADSVTLDGHKQFYAPVGVGVVLFRHPGHLREIKHTADYAVREGSADLGRHSVEGSRPGSAFQLHAAVHLLGRRGYAAAIESTVAQAATLAADVQNRPELDLVLPPELNLVVYRYRPPDLRGRPWEALDEGQRQWVDELNTEIHKRQRAAGRTMTSRTRWRTGLDPSGCTVLRAVVGNPLTTAEDLRAVLNEQIGLGEALVREASWHDAAEQRRRRTRLPTGRDEEG